MSQGPILLWGLESDPPLRAVRQHLVERGAHVAFVDHAAVGRTSVRLSDGHFSLQAEGEELDLNEVGAAYLRPYDTRLYGTGTADAATGVHHLVYEWAEGSVATIVNRPSAEASNHSKLLQAPAIRGVGFATPESLVTNEREQILAFDQQHGSLIYKSLSSVRSVVAELDPKRLPAGAMGPAFVQQRIRGTNVRVHVVGDRTFACTIESDGVDYRYAPARMAATTLEVDVSTACVALASRLRLVLAGIDLIAAEDGTWHCLEANPNPAFTSFDHDGSIASALADLLAEGADRPFASLAMRLPRSRMTS